MGKRKRSNASKKSNGAENGAASSQAAANAEQADVDGDCVHYKSSSEDSGNGMARFMDMESKVFGWASDSDRGVDSDMEKQDEKENEFMRSIELSRSKADESDVELNVEFFDPRKEDVSSLSMLLCKYCKACTLASKGKEPVTSAGAVARAVCAQTRVGTTIRLSDEEAPIGFISCLNVREHGKVLKDMKRKLVQVGEKQKNERFITLLNKCMEGVGRFESERMGLVLCERVVNMPTLVVAKMLEALCCEIEWATEDEKEQQQKDAFKFGWYLYIAEVYSYREEDEQAEDVKENSKKKRQRVESGQAEEKLAFARVEDSEWHKLASCSVSWDWGGAEDGVKQRRMAMIISAKKLATIRHAVEQRASARGADDVERGAEADERSAGDKTARAERQQ